MRTEEDLKRALADADHRGYPAYKRLAGSYRLGDLSLSIDHVQGDPFASPSQVSVRFPLAKAGIAAGVVADSCCCRAVEDLLVRRFSHQLEQRSFRVGGSGKSGLLRTSRPGPEVLRRSACEVAGGAVTLRFEAGFPAHGRTTDARALERMLLHLVPDAVRGTIDAQSFPHAAQQAAELAVDQHALRQELTRRGLVAFVVDGAVLPRESGVSSRPLKGAKPFRAPESLAVTLDLPNRGAVRGMGVPEGVTLIVGGAFHGKSTLLRALQEGVYDHVAGDGRELVATRADAVKLRAEDGRCVHDVDISLFVGDLPDGRSTRRFSTVDASGSTSQAAGTIEALETGSRTLLFDEDTSATNFMVRDALMEAVVGRSAEPLTPFAERVCALRDRAQVSCIIVAGSSGAFFPAADVVVQMQAYEPHDITDRVRAVCRERGVGAVPDAPGFALPTASCTAAVRVAGEQTARPERHGGRIGGRAHGNARGGGRGGAVRLKVRARGLDEVSVGRGSADVRLVEQLVDAEQTAAIAQLVRRAIESGLLDGTRTAAEVADTLLDGVMREGWAALGMRGGVPCGMALPRREELIACLNRWRA